MSSLFEFIWDTGSLACTLRAYVIQNSFKGEMSKERKVSSTQGLIIKKFKQKISLFLGMKLEFMYSCHKESPINIFPMNTKKNKSVINVWIL